MFRSWVLTAISIICAFPIVVKGQNDQQKMDAAAIAIQLVGQSETTLPWMVPGQIRLAWVEYKNVGTNTWDNTNGVSNPNYMELRSVEGTNCVLLSSHCAYPGFGSSNFLWINRERITNKFDSVAGRQIPPGANTKFYFWIIAPGTGSCRQYVAPWAIPGCMGNWAYFDIQVDGELPNPPASVSAMPPVSNSNSFGFNWSAGSDAVSGISGYSWRINGGAWTTVGPSVFSVGASSIPNIVEGTNFFSIRSIDLAGNISSENQTTFIYDTQNPNAPTNVVVTPPQNFVNSFAMSWFPSSDASSGIKDYLWSVNGAPEQMTTSTSLPAGAYGVEGVNTFSVRARDNINLVSSTSTVTFKLSCCVGIRGNVNYLGEITVSDLTYLVQYLFNDGPAPPCFDEGNVNGISAITVADLTYLVQYLFNGGPPPPACP